MKLARSNVYKQVKSFGFLFLFFILSINQPQLNTLIGFAS